MPNYGFSATALGEGAQTGLQQLIRQRLLERQMALAEQAQQDNVGLRERELTMRQEESQANRDINEELRRDALNTQSQAQSSMAVDRAARQMPHQFKLAKPQAETFKAYGYPVNEAVSQEQLNSPLANEALTPDEFTYGGNAPTPRAPGSPVKIRGLNGKPVFANPEDAIGKEAWDEPRAASGGGSGGTQLTPQALDMAATVWVKTGQLVALGMGAANDKKLIMNRAAEMYPNGDPAAGGAEYKSDLASLTQLTKRIGAIKPYAAQASLSLENVRRASQTVPRTGSPMLNRYKNWVSKNLTGQAPLSQFEVYAYNAARDYARVTQGGAESVAQMTDAASAAADALLNTAQNPEQIEAVIAAMQNDMNNTTSTLERQLADTNAKIRLKPGEKPAASHAPKRYRIENGQMVEVK